MVRGLLVAGALLVATLVALGVLMPSSYRIERSAVINAPAEKIYGLIADPREWRKWSVWSEREPNMKITRADPDRSIEYVLGFPDTTLDSRGALVLAAEGGGTKVLWTNAGDVGRNPLRHLFVPFLESRMGSDFDRGLANLKALAEKR